MINLKNIFKMCYLLTPSLCIICLTVTALDAKEYDIIKEIDINNDGKVDARIFMKDGRFVRREIDTDFNGVADEWYSYKNGVEIKHERDTTGDGKPNEVLSEIKDLEAFLEGFAEQEKMLHEGVINPLIQMCETDPTNYDASVKIARVYLFMLGQQEKARSMLENLYQKAPQNNNVLLFKAFMHYEYLELDAAIKTLLKLITLNPQHTKAHNLLGYLYHKNGNIEESITEYNKVLAVDPDNVLAKHNLKVASIGKVKQQLSVAENIVDEDGNRLIGSESVTEYFPINPFEFKESD